MKKYSTLITYFILIFQTMNAAENNQSIQWNGQQYKENSFAQYHYGTYALSLIPFKADDTVLDVGCGTGY